VARVTRQKARRKWGCGGCGRDIVKGEEYYKARRRYAPMIVRCLDCGPPKASELTSSETLSQAYAIAEALDGTSRDSIEDMAAALEDAYNELDTLIDEVTEKKSNLEEAFPSGCPAMEILEEYETELEGWREEIDNAKNEVESLQSDHDEVSEDDFADDAEGELKEEGVKEPSDDDIMDKATDLADDKRQEITEEAAGHFDDACNCPV